MKIFLDSANLNEIEDCLKKGVIQGITTNPSILSTEPKTDFIEHLRKIAVLCTKYDKHLPLSVEVLKEKPSEMYDEANDFVKRIGYSNIYIKIPLTGWEELEIIKKLTQKGIKVNCTCLFNEAQCLLAAHAGASYVSLFRGRMKDAGINADAVITNTRKMLDEAKLPCEIIVGSIRGPSDITDSLLCGGHIATAGFKHIQNMAIHPKSLESAQQFLRDFHEWIK